MKPKYKSEAKVRSEIEIMLSKHPEMRLWENPSGNGVVGDVRVTADGGYFIPNGRRVKFGGMDGTHDYIGIKSVKITPDMVGQTVGIFVSVETKKEDWRPPTIKQDRAWKTFIQQFRFYKMVKALGGITGFAKSARCAESFLFESNSEHDELMDYLTAHVKEQLKNAENFSR